MKNIQKVTTILIAVLICALYALPACAEEPEYRSYEEMGGARVGLLTGMPFENMITAKIPDIGGFAYFASMTDETLALKAHKIDAIFINNALIDFATSHNPELVKMSEHYLDSNFGFAFPKGDPQRDVWGAIIDRMKADGTIDALWEKWMLSDDTDKSVPRQDWPGKAGKVRVACADTFEPMCYVGKNKQMMGFDVEILLNVARELDLKVTFIPMEFGALMPTIQSGKADVAIGDIVITDERAQIMDFASYAPAYFTMLIRKTGAGAVADQGFFASLGQSFERTFIKEERYKMILSGLGTTVLIALLSNAIGLALAYGLVFIRRTDNPIANRLISGYNSLIAGVPAAVILMVLYYIIFTSDKFHPVVVAIIGFSLIYCSRAYGIIWNGVTSVDGGQREVALALGYDETLAFREVILPQSERHYRPLLFSQFIMLLKETSVAGYITVLELTRAGDLIRSRTMEAFFPLISVAVIYFFLTFLMTRIARRMDRAFTEKHHNHKIKGVDE